LRKIKEHCKQSGTSADTEEAKDAFMAVYFAAIASAQRFHNAKISHHTDQDLYRFFEAFCRRPWIIEELRSLFIKASEQISRNAASGDIRGQSPDISN
jgi:hypothetical protein